ncbi:MAG TPA: type II toxin-antitoxin system VapC family toxin [Tepidisphaeraceae bacterium]|nr:type II toxin-antitoxin system VapC family toxin [Tepidisphaeraceae bacterium]
MEWVFDASVTMAWCFDDERTPETDAMLDRLLLPSPAVVAQIWPLEIVNVLVMAYRKGRITVARGQQFLATMQCAPVAVDRCPITTVFNEVMLLADKYHLTAYDASYLELAMRLGVPLATLDRDLRKAAVAAGIQLL